AGRGSRSAHAALVIAAAPVVTNDVVREAEASVGVGPLGEDDRARRKAGVVVDGDVRGSIDELQETAFRAPPRHTTEVIEQVVLDQDSLGLLTRLGVEAEQVDAGPGVPDEVVR